MATDEALRLPDADAERINIPANPKHYWRYRMHLNIEDLAADKRSRAEYHRDDFAVWKSLTNMIIYTVQTFAHSFAEKYPPKTWRVFLFFVSLHYLKNKQIMIEIN